MTFVSYSLQEAFVYTVRAVHYSTGIALLPMGSLACRVVKKNVIKQMLKKNSLWRVKIICYTLISEVIFIWFPWRCIYCLHTLSNVPLHLLVPVPFWLGVLVPQNFQFGHWLAILTCVLYFNAVTYLRYLTITILYLSFVFLLCRYDLCFQLYLAFFLTLYHFLLLSFH